MLSTIHTNSATGTIQRMINMGVEPFLLASAMKMVISQRLAKRICKECKVTEVVPELKMKKIKGYLENIMNTEDIEKLVFQK